MGSCFKGDFQWCYNGRVRISTSGPILGDHRTYRGICGPGISAVRLWHGKQLSARHFGSVAVKIPASGVAFKPLVFGSLRNCGQGVASYKL